MHTGASSATSLTDGGGVGSPTGGRSAGVSPHEIDALLTSDPVLVDIIAVDGTIIITSFPVAASMYTSDLLAIAGGLAGMLVESLEPYGLFQRLLNPSDPTITATFTAGSALLPVDMYLPLLAKPALSLLQRDLLLPMDRCGARRACFVFCTVLVERLRGAASARRNLRMRGVGREGGRTI